MGDIVFNYCCTLANKWHSDFYFICILLEAFVPLKVKYHIDRNVVFYKEDLRLLH